MPICVTASALGSKDPMRIMTNKIYECTDEQFVDLIKNSANISEVLFKLGYTIRGNSWGFSQVKQRMTDLNLSFDDFKGRNANNQSTREIPNNLLFTENGKHLRHVIRRRIIRDNLIPYKCQICGLSEWNGKTLSLELDHINGINNDNRLENLRFLCPNCHSQTSTYGSRNQKLAKSKYDISDELRNRIIEEYNKYKSVKKVASTLGIVRKVVTTVVNETGQKHSNQKYVIRLDKNHYESARYGSLVEAAKELIKNGEVATKNIKTCTRSISYNRNKFWLNSYWIILDGSGIINNPLLESSLIDSEDNSRRGASENSVTD